MSTTLTTPRRTAKAKFKQAKPQRPPRTPDYITILPPGELIEEKMFEMGIDAAELARRMKVSVETVEKLLRFEIPLTRAVAEKLEKVTWMNADLMMRHETSYRTDLKYAMEHPEIPAYLGGKIINQPKQAKTTKGGETSDKK
jgi:plasmid maintenance system antidote protein VapI